jgi:ABC-type dipeptide/oligopeptide/nickel transport system permease component
VGALVGSLVMFSALHFLPGDPVAREHHQTPVQYARGMHQLGLDLPLPNQYAALMWRILDGDLARTLQPEAAVSARVGLLAALIAVASGMVVGMAAARRPNSVVDRVLLSTSLVVYSIPNFMWAFILLIVGVTMLSGLTGGLVYYSPGPCCSGLQYLMPALALGTQYIGYIARHTRASLLEELRSDYATTARAKGLAEEAVVRAHALRNAMIAILSILGPVVTTLITGSFVIEILFGVRGLGHEMIAAVLGRHYDVGVGVLVYYALLIGVANFLVDLLYPILDPRVKF